MEGLAAQIAETQSWDRSQCLDAWNALAGSESGSRPSLRFLRKALIFELQCKELGGHSAAVRRRLRASARTEGAQPPTQSIARGTQLVREWNGRVCRVDVTADGFEMDGQSFSSLSAVAKRITGAEWSGPRFFGLKGRKL